ncbi:MAG: outer membrane beta-barrel protein, partial [Daejeonella sp.]
MRKVLTVTLGCILATGVFAQTSEIKFGVKAGVNFAKIALSGSGYDDDQKEGSKFLTSFHFAGLVDIPISNSFSVQPGLSLSGKGSKSEFGSEADGKLVGKENIMYLEVPVNFVYKNSGFY